MAAARACRLKQVVARSKVGPFESKTSIKRDLDQQSYEISSKNKSYLHIEYLSQLRQQVDQKADARFVAFSRSLIIALCGYLLNFDLTGELNRRHSNREAHHKEQKLSFRFSCCLNKLFLLLSIGSAIYLAINAVTLYAADICRLKLARLREWISIYGSDHPIPSQRPSSNRTGRPMLELEIELLDHLADISSRTLMKSSLTANFGLLFELGLVLFLVCFAWAHLLPRLTYTLFAPFDFPQVRDLLAQDLERRRTEEICAKVVANFIGSSRQFDKLPLANQWDCCERGQPSGQTIELSPSDSRACHQLMKMYEHGALLPISKSPKWTKRSNSALFGFQVAILSGLALFDMFMIAISLFLLYSNIIKILELSWLDMLLVGFSIFWLIIVIFASVVAYAPLVLVYHIQMIGSIERLQRLICSCIRGINADFELYRTKRVCLDITSALSSGVRCRERDRLVHIIDRMNSNYLFVLATLKVLQLQLAAHKRVTRPFIPIAYGLSFLVPLFARLHMPYFDEAKFIDGRQLRWFALILGLIVLVLCDMSVVPYCHMHNGCLRLYRSLTNLMAHIRSVQLLEPHLFDACAVDLLKKEILKPDQFLERLVIRACGLKGTLSTLMKCHFWWSLVTFSLVVDYEFSSFDSLLRDPLRVYSF